VLFILFGGLANIVNAFPVVAALRERFRCETAWLTSLDYVPLVKTSVADVVYGEETPGLLPWDWIHSKGFTHVFFAEPEANQEEWERLCLSPIDFMAFKCGVKLETHRAWLEPDAGAVLEAEKLLRQWGLKRSAFITASHGDGQARHWPNSNLMKLGQKVDMPLVIFGKKTDPQIPGAISCVGTPSQVIAAIVRWSCFYLGPVCGVSMLATTTDTPMAVFVDPLLQTPGKTGIRQALRGEKDNIEEWDIYASLPTVLAHIEAKLPAQALSRA
jgi:hypothetical protein